MTFNLTDLGPNMRLQFVTMACGQHLGSGDGRAVFACEINPLYVLKIENRGGSFQNICEWELWQTLKDTPYAKWLAPCERISVDGGVLLQFRTVPIPESKLPKRLPVWLGDFKPENFGLYQGRVVCHDYGLIHVVMCQRGLSSKLAKVKWRGVQA